MPMNFEPFEFGHLEWCSFIIELLNGLSRWSCGLRRRRLARCARLNLAKPIQHHLYALLRLWELSGEPLDELPKHRELDRGRSTLWRWSAPTLRRSCSLWCDRWWEGRHWLPALLSAVLPTALAALVRLFAKVSAHYLELAAPVLTSTLCHFVKLL